jgi:hypothetical protein
MEKRLDTIEQEVRDIKSSVNSIDKTLAVNTASLIEHMRRTAMNEERIDGLERTKYLVLGGVTLLSLLSAVFAILEYFK